MFAYGMTLYEIISLQAPFQKQEPMKRNAEVRAGKRPPTGNKVRKTIVPVYVHIHCILNTVLTVVLIGYTIHIFMYMHISTCIVQVYIMIIVILIIHDCLLLPGEAHSPSTARSHEALLEQGPIGSSQNEGMSPVDIDR